MAQRLLLHIGLHKSGSTAIQNFCVLNRDRLRAQGVCYPRVAEKWNGHHPYAWSLGVEHPHHADTDDDAATLAGNMLAEAAGNDLLVSSEDLEFLGARQMRRILEDFAGFEISIVVYLRRQDSYLESEYAQHVRMDGTRFSGDIKDFYMSFDFSQRYNYRRLLQRWEEMFGVKALLVRPFQESRFVGGGLLQDFCSTVGLRWDDAFDLPAREASNVSLPIGALRVLREVNKLDLDVTERARILEILARQPKTHEKVMDDSTRRAFMGAFERTNARVAERYLDRGSTLFDDD